MADSEKVTVSKRYCPSDFGQILQDISSGIPVKQMIILFILYILVSSDVFINRVMGRVDGAISYTDTLSTYGTVLSGLVLVLLYVLFDILIKKEVI